jgi:hypothetical protein
MPAYSSRKHRGMPAYSSRKRRGMPPCAWPLREVRHMLPSQPGYQLAGVATREVLSHNPPAAAGGICFSPAALQLQTSGEPSQSHAVLQCRGMHGCAALLSSQQAPSLLLAASFIPQTFLWAQHSSGQTGSPEQPRHACQVAAAFGGRLLPDCVVCSCRGVDGAATIHCPDSHPAASLGRLQFHGLFCAEHCSQSSWRAVRSIHRLAVHRGQGIGKQW